MGGLQSGPGRVRVRGSWPWSNGDGRLPAAIGDEDGLHKTPSGVSVSPTSYLRKAAKHHQTTKATLVHPTTRRTHPLRGDHRSSTKAILRRSTLRPPPDVNTSVPLPSMPPRGNKRSRAGGPASLPYDRDAARAGGHQGSGQGPCGVAVLVCVDAGRGLKDQRIPTGCEAGNTRGEGAAGSHPAVPRRHPRGVVLAWRMGMFWLRGIATLLENAGCGGGSAGGSAGGRWEGGLDVDVFVVVGERLKLDCLPPTVEWRLGHR